MWNIFSFVSTFFYRKWYFSFEYKQCRLQSKLLNFRTRQLVRPLPFPFEWIISGRCLWSDFAKPVDILVAGNMYEVWWRKLVETFHWSSTCHIIKKPYLCYDRVAINSSCSHIFFFFFWSQWNIFLKLGIRWCCRFNVWYYQLRLELMNKTHKQCLNLPNFNRPLPVDWNDFCDPFSTIWSQCLSGWSFSLRQRQSPLNGSDSQTINLNCTSITINYTLSPSSQLA